MNMYFHRRGHVFVVQKIWNQLYDFMPSFLLLLKKVYLNHLIPLVYKTQKDINIISKIFLNIFINLEYFILSIGIQQSITIIIM